MLKISHIRDMRVNDIAIKNKYYSRYIEIMSAVIYECQDSYIDIGVE